MVNGDNVTVSVKDGKVTLNGNVHIIASVQASNGMVHIVDGVLLHLQKINRFYPLSPKKNRLNILQMKKIERNDQVAVAVCGSSPWCLFYSCLFWQLTLTRRNILKA